MTKICFVSYEIYPTVARGAGVLLHHSARVLLAQGHEVIFLLDLDDELFRQFNDRDRLNLPNAHNCRAYLLKDLLRGRPVSTADFLSFYQFKSYQFYLAARRLDELEQPEIIEFFEYCGVAYYSLSAKIAGLAFAAAHLAVRLHNSIELIDRQQPGMLHAMDRYIMYGLEHQGMRLAETVLYPAPGYLAEQYLNHYEPWFGAAVHSQPALLEHPVARGRRDDPNGVLFYGRLSGIKGVDRFVDAAVLYLSDPANPRRVFYLVGGDSYLPPTSQGSYRDYLLKKIPAELHPAFIFMGQLSWQQLGELLPDVLFAVAPSYQESFNYAAHEIYAAGVPLIVADIPAFKDAFRHGENALVFDGSVGDLAEQMRRLSCDDALRRRLSFPYPVIGAPLGEFYDRKPAASWIQTGEPDTLPGLLVCILVDDARLLEQTLASLQAGAPEGTRLVLLHAASAAEDAPEPRRGAAAWLLGGLYAPCAVDGAPLNPAEIRTAGVLLILKAGDTLEPDFLRRGLGILARQPQIAYVGGWLRLHSAERTRLDTTPLDAAGEIVPFIRSTPFSRALLRTEPGRLLIDLFDPRAGRLGELGYLWRLDGDQAGGVVIPQAAATCADDPETALDQPTLDYLILNDLDPRRKARLARFSLSLDDRAQTLRRFSFEWDTSHSRVQDLNRLQGRIAASRLSRWMDRAPGLKKVLRRTVEVGFASLSRLLALGRRK